MTGGFFYTHRYVLRAVIEFTTPFLVGAGKKGDVADAVFVADAHGFPALPGSGIAGVLRGRFEEAYGKEDANRLFGFQKGDQGEGSRLTVSWGCIHNSDGVPMEGIVPLDKHDDPVLARAMAPSIRDHVRINHKGASSAEERGKFDEQAVCAGHRFTFEMEMVGGEGESALWEKLLSLLATTSLRFGGKTRRGYGAFRFVSLKERAFDLRRDFDDYAAHPVSLAQTSSVLKEAAEISPEKASRIEMSLAPRSFWMIGGGCELPEDQGEADMAPLRDSRIFWQDGKGTACEDVLVIPASSVKGALSHRTAFHYNAIKGIFADKAADDPASLCGENNTAVRELFGYCKDEDSAGGGRAGRVYIDDVYLSRSHPSQLVHHVGIDRFTGGARDQVLFSERPLWGGEFVEISISVDDAEDMEDRENVLKAFRAALLDLADGGLQLGAGSGRGMGYFKAETDLAFPDFMNV